MAKKPPACPICGKPVTEASRPFCSPRCAQIDLGRWLTGEYRVPGPPAELDDGPASPDRQD
ncbi:MAG TPA: DNA gyrase inhibitor YacG [Acetobacteraceae bacterium]|nr:DNA gyrase inhibitor YacG [Acetobacteraceae bacterium]